MQEFTIEGRLPGYNELHNGGWQKAWVTKREAMQRVGMAALRIKPITSKVIIRIACYEPNAKRDPDNVISGAYKVVLDALQKYGKLPNDSRKWVSPVFAPVRVDRKNPRVEVIIASRLEDLV